MGLSQPPEGPHLRQTDRDSVHSTSGPLQQTLAIPAWVRGSAGYYGHSKSTERTLQKERTNFGSVSRSGVGPKPGAWRVGGEWE